MNLPLVIASPGLIASRSMMALFSKRVQAADKSAPPPALPVLVINNGTHYLAYRDKNDRWVEYYTGELLLGLVRILRKPLH